MATEARLTLRAWPTASEIVVNGTDLARGCRAFTLSAEVGEVPRLELDLAVFEVAAVGEVKTLIPDSTHETLVALGWTPPSEEGGG